MSSTYSINDGQITEAFKLADINSVLNELPDNVDKLIDPHDIRDAIYTSWENIVIKPTTNNASIEYIGIDRDNLYEKIFLGKKKISGSDILSSYLLNSDVDIFFYNTKTDTNLNSQNTKIGFLSGSSQSVFYYGNTLSIPFIETKFISTINGNVLDFNINNNSYIQTGATYTGGNISIQSSYGYVILNGLIFPTISDNSVVSDGSTLLYKNIGGHSYLQWGTLTASVSDINTSATFSINANPFLINGYDAMFTDAYPMPTTIGGLNAGTTFSNAAVTEVLRQLLYPYLPPITSFTTPNSYVEVSSLSQVVGFSFSITKYVASSTISSISTSPSGIITNTSAILTYLNVPTGPITYTGTVSWNTSAYFSSYGYQSFTLSVIDNMGGSSSSSLSIEAVYPIFYGTSTTASATQSIVQSLLGSFNKLLSSDPNQTLPLNGNGVCIYYLVPSIYNSSGSMSALYDSNAISLNINSIFRGNGTPFTMSLSSPSSYWAGVLYNCYIYSPSGTPTTTTIGNPTLYTANYQFVF